MASSKLVSLLLLVLVLFAVGCTAAGTQGTSAEENINSEEEATNTLMNVSSGVEDVGSTLDNIDDLLG